MISGKVQGIPELKAALASLVPKLRVRALRNALAAGARVVQKVCPRQDPIISAAAPAVRKGYRKPRTVERAISVRTSKLAKRAGNVGVFVNVRPAKKGSRGGKNPNDPFYWRWLNWDMEPGPRQRRRRQGRRALPPQAEQDGRGQAAARRALPGTAGAQRLGDALNVFRQGSAPQIARLNKPKGALN
jgi:hypothetical protein